ncbi:MAG: hypothetical protein AAGK00_06255 [Pseudomonadota bacterium]
MSAPRLVIGCVITWVVAVILSFAHPYYAISSGDGSADRGDLLELWMGWQVCALMMAIAALIVRLTRRAELEPYMKILAIAPIGASTMAGVALAIFLTNSP